MFRVLGECDVDCCVGWEDLVLEYEVVGEFVE